MSVGSEGMVLCLDLALTDPLSVSFIRGGEMLDTTHPCSPNPGSPHSVQVLVST